MNQDLKFLDDFEDKYLRTAQGKGVFLASIVIGYMARLQVNKSDDIHNAPLFKQINFGRMTMRDLKKQLSRVPELIKAYSMKYSVFIQQLANVAGALILEGGGEELGVNGNFVFMVGFSNASNYFWIIYKREGNIGELEEMD